MGGAVRLPAALLLWAGGLLLWLFEFEHADAMLPPAQPPILPGPPASGSLEPLRVAAALKDPAAIEAGLRRHSEVVSGRWRAPAPALAEIPIPLAEVALPRLARRAMPEPAQAAGPASPTAVSGTVDGTAGLRKVPVTRPLAAPPRASLAKTRARAALRAGRFAAAYRLLRPGVRAARHDTEHLGLLALAALRLGQHQEAVVLYRHLATLEPGSVRWRSGLAAAHGGPPPLHRTPDALAGRPPDAAPPAASGGFG